MVAVLTGADFMADGMKPIPHNPSLVGPPDVVLRLRPGFDTFISTDYPMPADKVRFVGEVVALVLAETIEQAKDGADLVEVDYEPLPAVSRASDAVKAGAPKVWDEAASNLCVDVEVGDAAATAAAFKTAAACRAARHLDPARHRRTDGDPHFAREL